MRRIKKPLPMSPLPEVEEMSEWTKRFWNQSVDPSLDHFSRTFSKAGVVFERNSCDETNRLAADHHG